MGGRRGGDGLQQALGGMHRHHQAREPRLQFGAAHQAEGLGVFQADDNALDRGVGIQGQPGGARLGDGQLHDQQVDAARQPQAQDLAWRGAGLDQPVAGEIGARVQFGVAEAVRPVDEGDLVGMAPRRVFENVGQGLGAQQLRLLCAMQDIGCGHLGEARQRGGGCGQFRSARALW